VIWSFHLVIWSSGHLVIWSFGHLVIWSFGHLVIGRCLDAPMTKSNDQMTK
jgi:hypothetical protein